MANETTAGNQGGVAGLSRRRQMALAGTAVIVYSAVAVATEPWNWYSRIFTTIPGIIAVWYAISRGWHRIGGEGSNFEVDGVGALSLIIWSLLVTVTVAWILAIFFSHPRETYPTLSHLMNITFENYPLRVGGFVAWLALGWYLLRR